jgi:hypothetical protein
MLPDEKIILTCWPRMAPSETTYAESRHRAQQLARIALTRQEVDDEIGGRDALGERPERKPRTRASLR